jgi:tetratricopeptide (TPR) repeat protein
MAPEQLWGDWREWGAWTDLYALGCTAWRLATGRVPFFGREEHDLVRAQLHDTPTGFLPQIAVPEGLRAWLAVMMAKAPEDRFQCAADAARALQSLPQPPAERIPRELPQSVPDETLMLPPSSTQGIGGRHARPDTPRRGRPAVEVHIPTSWRADEPSLPRRLAGAGRGLWGLREAALIGREAERDALWSALRDVQSSRQPRAVVVRGARGLGSTRLLQWLARRANEEGAAEVMEAVHGPGDTGLDPLRRLLGRWFRTDGLPRLAVPDRILPVCDDARDAAVIAEWIAPANEVERQREGVIPPTPDEAFAVLRRLLARVAGERTVVVTLDDVQRGAAGLGLVRRMLQEPGDALPVLFLCSSRSEDLARRPAEQALLTSKIESDRADAIELDPLPETECHTLVESLVGLEPGLTARIADRAAGNPQMAVRLVGHLIDRDALAVGPRGFDLRDAVSLEMPTDLLSSWSDAIGDVLHDLPEQAGISLERAATLGRVVRLDEWRALDDTDDAVVSELIDRLVRRRLVEVDASTLTFLPGGLNSAVQARAHDAGRRQAHHGAAARMLGPKRNEAGVAERLGRHLLRCGRNAEAVDALLEGAKHRMAQVGLSAALALVEEAREALSRSGAPPSDRRWGLIDIEGSKLRRLQGGLAAARTAAERALGRADRFRWPDLSRAARLELGEIAMHEGRLDEAIAMLEAVLADARLALHDHDVAEAAFGVAGAYRSAGDREGARVALSSARRAYRRLGDASGVAGCEFELGTNALILHDLDRAQHHYDAALELYEVHGPPHGEAQTLNGLGEVARKRGHLDRATARYRESLAVYLAIGVGLALMPRANLGLVLLTRGRFDEARVALEGAAADAERQGRKAMVLAATALLLHPLAVARDRAGLDAAIRRAEELFAATRFGDPDMIASARAAAGLMPDRAPRLHALADKMERR